MIPIKGFVMTTGRPGLVIEVAKEAEDVRVSQVGLDLDLPPQLVLHLELVCRCAGVQVCRCAGVRV